MFKGIDDGTFSEKDLDITEETAATVMLVSAGYPESYEKNKKISGHEFVKESIVFHAGTKNDLGLKTNGGTQFPIGIFFVLAPHL